MKDRIYTILRKFSIVLTSAVFFCFSYSAPKTLVLNVDQAITPPVLAYITEGIEHARINQFDSLIIQLDTPGGLYTTTRDIGQAFLNSPVPIMTYVSPNGARASSAGTFMLYASHIAAMAPSTHLGSATPIALSGDQDEKKESAAANKIMEDTLAYMRSLAQHRGRNEKFGIAAITTAKSLTAEEALRNGAIEIVANDIQDLLKKADGYQVKMVNNTQKLDTLNAKVTNYEPSLKQRILFTITDPNITYLLLMAGIYGLMIELFNPGSIVPGIIGAICILIAAYSLQILPINYAGLGLIALGVGFLTAEAFIPSFGIFGFAGILALTIGSFFLFEGIRWAAPSIWFMLAILLSLSVTFLALVRINIKNHLKRPISGIEGLINTQATVVEADGSNYTIRVLGQLWSAHASEPLSLDQTVIIDSFDGLTANVTPLGD